MLYKSFPPSPHLREFVRNYTLINLQFEKSIRPPVKPRSPKPEQKIAFYLDGRVSLINSNGVRTSPPPVAIYSHQTERKDLQVSSSFVALIVFLRPGVLYRMIRLPMSEFTVDFSDAEIFFGTEVRSVRERLMEAGSPSKMINAVEEFLLRRLIPTRAVNSLDLVADTVLSDPASFSLDLMAAQACLSTKQFYRKFVERIGITPKYFSMLCRFNHASRYKLDHPRVSWSSIALEYSYTDYHHMEKEFKKFLGVTPAEWINAELAAPERILKLR